MSLVERTVIQPALTLTGLGIALLAGIALLRGWGSAKIALEYGKNNLSSSLGYVVLLWILYVVFIVQP